jgi:hypothetical protein
MTRRWVHRVESRLFRVAVERLGVEIDHTWILEVPGRRSGLPRFAPVKVLQVEAERFLVSLYDSDWARNLRAAGGRARLRRRGMIIPALAVELPAPERPAILRAYLAAATRGQTLDILGAGRRDPEEDHLRRIAADHPVFRLAAAPGATWPDAGAGVAQRPGAPKRLGALGRVGPAHCAAISGASGLVSGLCLILFFGLARPFSGEPSPWSWLGPANDLTSALQAAALIPVALTLRNLVPGRSVGRWTTVGVSAMAAATILPLILVAGLLPFAVQAPMVTLAIVIMFCWMFAISRAGGRSGALAPPAARAGMATTIALGAAGVAAALAAAVPSGSAVRTVAVGLAVSAGVIAWLGFPAWTLLLQPALRHAAADTRVAETSSDPA